MLSLSDVARIVVGFIFFVAGVALALFGFFLLLTRLDNGTSPGHAVWWGALFLALSVVVILGVATLMYRTLRSANSS